MLVGYGLYVTGERASDNLQVELYKDCEEALESALFATQESGIPHYVAPIYDYRTLEERQRDAK